MSRFQKICLASALVVAGFGVAKFLGQPVKLSETLQSYRAQAQTIVATVQQSAPKVEASSTVGSVRLLPDAQVTRANSPGSPALGGASHELAVSDLGSRSTNHDNGTPRAALRNEAPRPVGIDPQSPAAIHRAPPVNNETANPYKVVDAPSFADAPKLADPPRLADAPRLAEAPTASMDWPAPQLMTVGYSAPDAPAPQSPATITASFNQSVNASVQNQLSPPAWPANDEIAQPRTHIIVDGDTLEKLAGRYLTDSGRSREIYELNRELLSSPDLLPIGAELKIPERIASVPRDRQVWQPNSSLPHPGFDASCDNIMPVRPTSAATGIIPRAQLSRPVMVE